MPPSTRLHILRPDDLLVLTYEFFNFRLDGPRLRRLNGDSAYVAVILPPQHLFEQSFDAPNALGEASERILSGESRLVFDIPSDVEEIPYTTSSLLAILRNRPRVSASASTAPPGDDESAIEAPFRVVLSPDDQASWAYDEHPQPSPDRALLWQLRSKSDGTSIPLSVVWTPDLAAEFDPDFTGSLSASDRKGLLRVLDTNETAVRPVRARQFALSSLGSSFDIRDSPSIPPHFVVASWSHSAELGRDHEVQVVRRGTLYPFGYRASYVKTTERSYSREWPRTAHLRTTHVLEIQDHRREFDEVHATMPELGRAFPFKEVYVAVDRTPPLVRRKVAHFSEDDVFWPLAAAFVARPKNVTLGELSQVRRKYEPLEWFEVFGEPVDKGTPSDYGLPLVGHDLEGHEIHFSAPIVFVSDDALANHPNLLRVVRDFYRSQAVEMSVAPQDMALAPSLEGDDSALKATLGIMGLGFDATLGSELPPSSPVSDYFPKIASATVRSPALRELVPGTPELQVEFNDFYLKHGFDENNKGDVFLNLRKAATMVLGSGQARSGGLISPNMTVVALSRRFGPVGGRASSASASSQDVSAFISGRFNTAAFTVDATVLGGVTLKDLLPKWIDFDIDPRQVPGFTTRVIRRDGKPVAVVTEFQWETALKDEGDETPMITTDNTKLSVKVQKKISLDPNEPGSTSVVGVLTDFSIKLLPGAGWIQVQFTELRFELNDGESPVFTPRIGGIKFLGDLEFLETLAEMLPISNLPRIEIARDWIAAHWAIDTPPVKFGVFSLESLRARIGFTLPFGDAPIELRLSINSYQNPFMVSVATFGGSGYFDLGISSKGIERVDIGIAFGGAMAFGLGGVAEGALSLMGGIRYRKKRDAVEFTGFVRAAGSLNVLGVISIQVVFLMQLRIETARNGQVSAYGEVMVYVRVKLLFVSVTITVTFSRRFLGSSRRVKFAELFPEEDDWAEYCDAFA